MTQTQTTLNTERTTLNTGTGDDTNTAYIQYTVASTLKQTNKKTKNKTRYIYIRILTGNGRTSGRAMLNCDLNYEVPRATDSAYRLRMWL